MNKRKFVLPVLGVMILGGSVLGVGLVSANDANNPANTLVSRIAQKFNLDQSQVQDVFDEVHKEKNAERKTNFEQKLTKAVADGKITEQQKTVILEKFGHKFDQSLNHEDFKNMTKEQMQAKMREKKTELDNWAEDNGLSLETLREILGGDKGFGHRGHFFMMKP